MVSLLSNNKGTEQKLMSSLNRCLFLIQLMSWGRRTKALSESSLIGLETTAVSIIFEVTFCLLISNAEKESPVVKEAILSDIFARELMVRYLFDIYLFRT